MMSLVPGGLYSTPGLNRNSTPTPSTITPAELDELYQRQDFDGKPWPFDSPVHEVYDVKNTSSKMLILNNKYGEKYTRLRGYCPGLYMNNREIDTQRHFQETTPVNVRRHVECFDVNSPIYETDPEADLEWLEKIEGKPCSPTASSFTKLLETGDYSIVDDKTPKPIRAMSKTSLPPTRYLRQLSAVMAKDNLYSGDARKRYITKIQKPSLKEARNQSLPKLEAKKGQTALFRNYDSYYMKYIQDTLSRHDANSPASFRTRMELANRAPIKTEITAVSESHESAGKDKVADKVETEAERPESTVVEPPKKRPVTRSARMYSKRKRKLLPKIASEESMTSRSSVSNVSDILGIKSLERLDRRGDFIISSEMIQQKEGIDRPKSRLGRPVPEPVSSDSSLDNFISRVIDTAKVAVSKETFESALKKYISRVIDNARMAVSKEEEEKVKDSSSDISSDSSLNSIINGLLERIVSESNLDNFISQVIDSAKVTVCEEIASDSALDKFISQVIQKARVTLCKEKAFDSALDKFISQVIDSARLTLSKEIEFETALDTFISQVLESANLTLSKEVAFDSALNTFISDIIEIARMTLNKEAEEKVVSTEVDGVSKEQRSRSTLSTETKPSDETSQTSTSGTRSTSTESSFQASEYYFKQALFRYVAFTTHRLNF